MKKEKFILVILLLAILDQAIKLIVILCKNSLPVSIIRNVLDIVYCENYGAAFSIGSGSTITIAIVTMFIMAMILFVMLKYYEKFNTRMLTGLALLISGGIANLLDRVFRRYVVDYIYLSFIDFPVFNFADICVVVGVIIICLCLLIGDRGEKIGKNSSK